MELRVRFAETDQMGVAHHAAYAVWLEAARVEWLRDLGLSYRELDAQGVSLAVTGLDVRYRRAVRFDDLLRIEVVLEEARSRRLRIGYRIVRVEDGAVAAEATTVHVPTARSGAAVRLPAPWLDAISVAVVPAHGRRAAPA
ncbi:MAG: acyl-CoA thioesterase [Trueperaceae bacterium]